MNLRFIVIKFFGLDKPKIIRAIYKLDNKLTPELYKIPAIISLILAVLSCISIYLYYSDFGKIICSPILGLIAIWSFFFMLKFSIRDLIKNTGVDSTFAFSGAYIVKRKNGLSCILNLSDIDLDRFEFATPETAKESAIINLEAYEYSAWETNVEEKYLRNLSHIEKNKFSILLIKCKEKKNYIGFSHMLPISKKTWDLYIDRKIDDNNFSAAHIVSCENNNHKSYGIIKFSLGLRKKDKSKYDIPSNKDDIGDVLEQAVCFHLNALKFLFESGEDVDIPVLLQNMEKAYKDFYKDCAEFLGPTHDGATLIKFRIANN